jgi:hypothetical protein
MKKRRVVVADDGMLVQMGVSSSKLRELLGFVVQLPVEVQDKVADVVEPLLFGFRCGWMCPAVPGALAGSNRWLVW